MTHDAVWWLILTAILNGRTSLIYLLVDCEKFFPSTQKNDVDCSSETSVNVCELQFTSPKTVIIMTFFLFLVYLGGTTISETHTVCHPCDAMVGVSASKLTE